MAEYCLRTQDVIRFQDRLYRVETLSRKITHKVKLLPVKQDRRSNEFVDDGKALWFPVVDVHRYATLVARPND